VSILKKLRNWLFSLEGKFMAAVVICAVLFSAAAGFTVLRREERLYLVDSFHQCYTLSEISRLMLTNVMVYNEMEIMDRQDMIDYLDYFILNLMERDKRVIAATVLDSNGVVLSDSNISNYSKKNIDEDLVRSFQTFMPIFKEGAYEGKKTVTITTPLNIDTKTWGALRIVFSTEDVYSSIRDLRNQIIFFTFVLLIISLVIAKQPIVVRRHDELGKLQNSFFWFLKRLQDADRERERVTEQLVQHEKMVAMGHLSSGVAHEINNPLGGITICFKSLLKFTKKTPETDELVFAVEDGLQKINNIVTQLLGLSRSSSVENKPVDINKLINRLLVLFRHEAEKHKIEICLELDESLPLVFADDNKIAQVFMNLTINAIQAMGNSGSLTIATRREGSFCRISFGDTGEGIQPENMPFIFDPFFTTKKTGKGTGLGLSVSRGIIEQHDGTLRAESEPGRGATFTIRLHAVPEPLQDVKEVIS